MTCTRRPLPLNRRHENRTRSGDWNRMARALQRAAAYPHPAGCLTRVETHISIVYLAGRYAYKLCKPVNFGFVDFTTPGARYRCCLDALRLNQRLAAPIYLDVVAIVRNARTFKIGRASKDNCNVIDHALRMRRFDERDVFSALAASGALTGDDIDRAAARLAAFHRRASQRSPRPEFGSAALVAKQLHDALSALDHQAPNTVSPGLARWCHTELQRLASHIEQRRHEGFVRECHGDLHLDNMVRRGRDVAIFDCIEFSDALRWIDVTADIAFPVMDLLAREHGELATRLLNRWLTATGDFTGLCTLRFYVVYRALVRALVGLLKANARRSTQPQRCSVPDAARYLQLAEHLAVPRQPFLILCHGFSGSGKSTASEALALQLGAIRISSDIERKRERRPLAAASDRRLPSASYTCEAIDREYDQLRATTDALLDAGYPVIVDASFLKREHRASFAALARAHGIQRLIVDFHADASLLAQRLRARATKRGERSDADETVLARQRSRADSLSAEEAALTVTIETDVSPNSYRHRTFWGAVIERLPEAGWLAGRHRYHAQEDLLGLQRPRAVT